MPRPVTIRRETERLNRLIAEFAYRGMKCDPNCSHWGYKEIWNGSRGFATIEWAIYDEVFPRAKWVHLVRNPFTYAPSSAGFVGQETIAREQFENQVVDWVRIHNWNSSRKATGKYILARYEDISNLETGSLRGLLDKLGVGWHENCAKAMGRSYVPSKTKPIADSEIFDRPFRVDGLYAQVEELGYGEDIAQMGITIEDDRLAEKEIDQAVSG